MFLRVTERRLLISPVASSTRVIVKIRKCILQSTSIEVELDEQDFSIKSTGEIPALKTSDFFKLIYPWFSSDIRTRESAKQPVAPSCDQLKQPSFNSFKVLVFIPFGLLLPLKLNSHSEAVFPPNPVQFYVQFWWSRDSRYLFQPGVCVYLVDSRSDSFRDPS